MGLHPFEDQKRGRILPEEFSKVDAIEYNHMFHVKLRLWRARKLAQLAEGALSLARDAEGCKSCFEGNFL